MLTAFGGTIQQPLNNAGGIEPDGTLEFYATGTVTPKTVYHDAAGLVPWSFPVTLDGNGRALVFLNNDGAYDVVFKDADGAVVWTLTKIIAAAPAI